MALDPRLASVELLSLAAMRAQARQVTAPPRTVTVQVVYYDASGREPPERGESYTYELPAPGAGRGA